MMPMVIGGAASPQDGIQTGRLPSGIGYVGNATGGHAMDERLVSDPETGCVHWTGRKDRDGYGLVYIEGRSWRVHRYMYTKLVGPIPQKYVLDHLCKNRDCCAIDHLEAVP